ncbi:hypothetical protein Tco_0427992 [Tanacetum coccineum]
MNLTVKMMLYPQAVKKSTLESDERNARKFKKNGNRKTRVKRMKKERFPPKEKRSRQKSEVRIKKRNKGRNRNKKEKARYNEKDEVKKKKNSKQEYISKDDNLTLRKRMMSLRIVA